MNDSPEKVLAKIDEHLADDRFKSSSVSNVWLRTARDCIAQLLEERRWRDPVKEPPPCPSKYEMATYVVRTEDGQVMAMEWEANQYAKRPKDREPKWKWQGRNSSWTVVGWLPLPSEAHDAR